MQKTVLVTGATDGIGYKTAEALALKGFQVLLHGRDERKATQAVEFMTKGIKTSMIPFWADLSDLRQVALMAEKINSSGHQLDVIIYNAGVYSKEFSQTQQGLELTFAVNHAASFYLTDLLWKALKSDSRLICVSSIAHERARIVFSELQSPRLFHPYLAYANSKLCNILFIRELARRNSKNCMKFYSLHPGLVTTKLLKDGFNTTGVSPEEGGTTSVYLASTDKVDGGSGGYFEDCKEKEPSLLAQDAALSKKLWDYTHDLISAVI